MSSPKKLWFLGSAVILMLSIGMSTVLSIKTGVANVSEEKYAAQQEAMARQVLEQSQPYKQQKQQKLQDIMKTLSQFPQLNEEELAALSQVERLQYFKMRESLVDMLKQMEEAEQENKTLKANMHAAAQKNQELTEKIDALRPDILRAQMEREAEREAQTQQTATLGKVDSPN